jgi:transcriptional regulator with XRE-family HTH domain
MKTIRDLCKEYGYSQTGLAMRFGIPLRTVQNWHGGQREPAPYVVPMMDEILRREKALQEERRKALEKTGISEERRKELQELFDKGVSPAEVFKFTREK